MISANANTLEQVLASLYESPSRQAAGRVTCRLHFTDLENCFDEHGIDLLHPMTPNSPRSERHA